MTPEERLIALIRKGVKIDAIREIGSGTVKSVEGQTCTVSREGQAELLEVQLTGSNDEVKNQVIEYPKIGSDVIYGIIDGQIQNAVIIKVSEIDRFVVKCGMITHEISEKGYSLKSETDSLQKILVDIINEIMPITPTTAANIPALTLIAERLKAFIK